MATVRFAQRLVCFLMVLAPLTSIADVPITPTHCTARFCFATYGINFTLKETRTTSQDSERERAVMIFEPSLVAAFALGKKVGICQSPTAKITLRRKGDTYLGNACFQVPAAGTFEYVAVGIAIKTTRPIEDYLDFDGLCVWAKEPVAGGISDAWRAQRLGPMRCVSGPNNSFKPKPLRGSA